MMGHIAWVAVGAASATWSWRGLVLPAGGAPALGCGRAV